MESNPEKSDTDQTENQTISTVDVAEMLAAVAFGQSVDERFVQTIKLVRLAKFVIFGRKHLGYLLAEFTSYYNEHRSHTCRHCA